MQIEGHMHQHVHFQMLVHLSCSRVLAVGLAVISPGWCSNSISLVGHAADTAHLFGATCTAQESAPCHANSEQPLSLLVYVV